MAIEIRIPRLGWSMEEGHFSQWLKPDGATVQVGDMLYELESDKAVQEVESLDGGILRHIPQGPGPGDVVQVGQLIGYLCAADERLPQSVAEPTAPAAVAARPETPPPCAPISQGALVSPPEGSGQRGGSPELGPVRRRVSPRAARLAAEWGVDLRHVSPSGASGRIRECDVRHAAQTTHNLSATEPLPAGGSHRASSDAPHTPSLRHTIAQKMLSASQSTAPVTLTTTANASALVAWRQAVRQTTDASGRVPGYTDLCLQLAGLALQRHPRLCTQWTDQGIVEMADIHLAVAIHTEQGLLAPVIRNVPQLTLAQIAAQLNELINKARSRKLTAADLAGGTMTVSNLGGYRVDAFTPILNVPQAAIWGIGQICAAPRVVGGNVVVCPQVTLSLTFDHRIVDGVPAAALLTTLCECIENPADFGIRW